MTRQSSHVSVRVDQVAWAHVRGGGELGRPWHAAARSSLSAAADAAGSEGRRRASSEDLIACARFLNNRSQGARLAGHATSAGVNA